MGMTVPREYGGPGRSFLDVTLVIEEMSAQCGVTGRIAVEGNMGAISTVMQYGTEAQKKRAAECVLSGDKPRSEEHTSELQSLMRISYAVFCLKKKTNNKGINMK